MNVFLPPFENVTVWHLRDIQSGAKKRIKSADVKHINVPQFEGLSIKDMQTFAEQYPGVSRYLPIEKEAEKLPRQYIANLIYTVVGNPFSVWVKA